MFSNWARHVCSHGGADIPLRANSSSPIPGCQSRWCVSIGLLLGRRTTTQVARCQPCNYEEIGSRARRLCRGVWAPRWPIVLSNEPRKFCFCWCVAGSRSLCLHSVFFRVFSMCVFAEGFDLVRIVWFRVVSIFVLPGSVSLVMTGTV